MLTVAVDPATDGRIGEYFYFNLTDANGKPLSNMPMEIGFTSSQKDAYLTNCMVEFENVTSDSSSPSSVSNLNFNTSIEKNPCVYILGSSYVDVFNCNAFSNGANSNPTLLVGSSYCNIHDNVFETNFTGYMNMLLNEL